MSKIGLLTFWAKNYGSALQCYALKSEIENYGHNCEVIGQCFPGLDKYKHYAKELLSLIKISICHPSYLKKYIMMRNAVKYSASSLSKESDLRLNLFCESVLQPHRYSYKHLRKLAVDDNYKYFVAGSDQIWAGNRKMEDIYFLKFAPPAKRIAYAPSFGTEQIDDYNKRSFRREIGKFAKVSVREQRGKEIIKELTGLDVPRIADPTLLKTREEWSEFANQAEFHEEKYILVHFLDEPNSTSLQCLSDLAKETRYKIIGFAYPHKVFQNNAAYQFADGDPRDYIAAIKNAEYILTDSFHTSLFSVIFQKKFFVFARQYRHNGSQQSRITTLLDLVGYQERFVKSKTDFSALKDTNLHSCENVLSQERNQAKQYLNEVLGFGEQEAEIDLGNATALKLADADTCTGCMACLSACKKNAVIVTTRKGYEVPQIDEDRCIKCGGCQKVCGVIGTLKVKSLDQLNSKVAYVAYNPCSELREKAASGGVFAALATIILRNGGVVFGARLSFNAGKPIIEHIPIYEENDLPVILQSKYVQSDASSAYPQIKQLLKESKTVLFCGTSCQVAGLYLYLGSTHYTNLYTVDLICHGVPGRSFFTDYIRTVEKKYKAKVEDFRFRTKNNGKIIYEETLVLATNSGDKIKTIPLTRSSYYRLFMSEETYRDACYSCKYASINKPADITLGDYFELEKDMPELYRKLSDASVEDVNSVIVHTLQGERLLKMAQILIERFPADLKKIQSSHKQLCKPSQFTLQRETIMKIYNKRGFEGINVYYKARDFALVLPIRLKRLIKRFN